MWQYFILFVRAFFINSIDKSKPKPKITCFYSSLLYLYILYTQYPNWHLKFTRSYLLCGSISDYITNIKVELSDVS